MNKPHSKVAVRAAINESSTLEIHILDFIYNDYVYDWVTDCYRESNIVADLIERVKNASPRVIRLIVDSQGGDAGIGLAMYTYLKEWAKNNGCTIETDIIGMAGSTASFVPMCSTAGKLRIGRNAFMVIHKAWGFGSGNSVDLRAAADVIDRYTSNMVDIYAQRNTKGKTAAQINTLIANGDYWMTGTEAIEMGFADALLEEENNTFQIAARIKDLDPAHYKNIPAAFAQVNNGTSSQQNNEPDLSLMEGDDESGLLTGINKLFMDLKKHVSAAMGKKPAPQANTETPAPGTLPAAAPPANPTPAAGVPTVVKEGETPAATPAAAPAATPAATTETAATPAQDAVMALLEPVLNAFAEGMQTEIDGELTTIRESITSLQTVNASLLKQNQALSVAAGAKQGAETHTVAAPNASVGRGKWAD